MQPRYSILYYKNVLTGPLRQEISSFLHAGIKVIWFGKETEVNALKLEYEKFAKKLFLLTYSMDSLSASPTEPATIIDGDFNQYTRNLLDYLERKVPAFNAAQYRVEHCLPEKNIVVKASAGTGKTTVMIDRIMYLMHMVPDLNMADIYMITFTNDATNQMNERLQEKLLDKYTLTHNQRYLAWLEQQSQMHISTIDSLAYDLFRKFGMGAGYGRDLSIKQFEKERKDLLKDILSDELNDKKTIKSQVGQNYSATIAVMDMFYRKFIREGYTADEIIAKDWGEMPQDPATAGFESVFKQVIARFVKEYGQLKLDENAIALNDLFFDFGHLLLDGRIDCRGLNMRYLFVDEFQDTDATQIKTFAKLARSIGAPIFVVGDTKQSIYAFKGATDAAFDIFDECMEGNLVYYELVNNYRTSKELMTQVERYFFAWNKMGLIDYKVGVRPFNTSKGVLRIKSFRSKADQNDVDMAAIENALDDLELRVRKGIVKDDSKAKVAVIVRGNARAMELSNRCKERGLNVVLDSDRPFFLSEAVRDFYTMISSYVFSEEPVYKFNYLLTPYASVESAVSIAELDKYRNDSDTMELRLKEYLSQTAWEVYNTEFRISPVLAVIKKMINETKVIENYIAIDKVHMYGDEWNEIKKKRQAHIDAKVYQANLNKLLDIIQQRLDGNSATLYDLYSYLTYMIATDRDTKEPAVDQIDDYNCVYIMTVHKSKGLEFDTVVLPAMNTHLDRDAITEIIVGKDRVGWNIRKDNKNLMTSSNYELELAEEKKRYTREQVRLMYVAMTRAINNMTMVVNEYTNYQSWSTLIREVGYNEQ